MRYDTDDTLAFKLIANQDLTCANCVYRIDDKEDPRNTSKCRIFENCKPGKVLTGGDCSEKKTEK